MYPNEYCQPCVPAPVPCINPPLPCDGNPCEEIILTQCTKYNGPPIPCLNISDAIINSIGGININTIFTLFSQAICHCQLPTITIESGCDYFTITITNPLTSIDLHEVIYSVDDISYIPVITAPGDTIITVNNLLPSTVYWVKIKKVCLATGAVGIPNGSYSAEAYFQLSTTVCPPPIIP